MANKILTVSELAEHLNVHRITIYRLLKSGTLPGFKIGRVWRFDLDEISAWMANGKSSSEMKTAADGIADGKAQSDGHLMRDGHPKAAPAPIRIQPPARVLSKETRRGNAHRRSW
jgi:excisionase family DNA binding protein